MSPGRIWLKFDRGPTCRCGNPKRWYASRCMTCIRRIWEAGR